MKAKHKTDERKALGQVERLLAEVRAELAGHGWRRGTPWYEDRVREAEYLGRRAATLRDWSEADRLTRLLTAFASWRDFLAAMAGGYVPTLRRTRACDKLARVVEAHGYRTFRIK
jgi:hypothetical protein